MGYEERKEGRKEGPTPQRGRGCAESDVGWVGASVFCLSNIKELVANFLPSSLRIPSYPAHPGSYETVFHLPTYARTHDAFQPGVPEFRTIVWGTEEW